MIGTTCISLDWMPAPVATSLDSSEFGFDAVMLWALLI
jgi:hypothetical protein